MASPILLADTGLEISPPLSVLEKRDRSAVESADKFQFETVGAASKFMFRFMIALDPLDSLGAASALEVFLQYYGYGRPFAQRWPQRQNLADIPSANKLNVQTNASGGATSVLARAVPTRIPPVEKGRYIKFSNHNKLYRVRVGLPTVSTTSTGTALTVYPELVVDVPTTATIDFNPSLDCKVDASTTLEVTTPADGIEFKTIAVREL